MAKSLVASLTAVLVAAMTFSGCSKEENTLVYSKTKLKGVSNLRAFSAGANSVGLLWSASPDTSNSQLTTIRVIAKIGNTEWSSTTVPRTTNETVVLMDFLNEGTVYTFEVVCVASPNSANYTDSDPVKISWAPARRLNRDEAVKVYEGAAPDSNGLQLFDGIGPHVFSARTPAYQSVLDVVLDSTASGIVIMKSAHLNRFGGGVRRTRFSTFDTLASNFNYGRPAPPDPSTYVRDSIFIGPEIITNGRVYYAVTHDGNYARLLLEKNSSSPSEPGSLLFGTQPNRYLRIRVSYQIVSGVIYAKPQPQPQPRSQE